MTGPGGTGLGERVVNVLVPVMSWLEILPAIIAGLMSLFFMFYLPDTLINQIVRTFE